MIVIGFYSINDRFCSIVVRVKWRKTNSVEKPEIRPSRRKIFLLIHWDHAGRISTEKFKKFLFLEHVLSGNLELSKNKKLWSNLFDILECAVYSQNAKITKHDFRENFSKMVIP